MPLDFHKAETFSTASVFWYDDGPWGGCRIPLSWGVQYKNEKGEWVDVKTKVPAKSEKDVLNKIEFEPVTSQSVRLQFQLPVEESTGVYEFEVK